MFADDVSLRILQNIILEKYHLEFCIAKATSLCCAKRLILNNQKPEIINLPKRKHTLNFSININESVLDPIIFDVWDMLCSNLLYNLVVLSISFIMTEKIMFSNKRNRKGNFVIRQ